MAYDNNYIRLDLVKSDANYFCKLDIVDSFTVYENDIPYDVVILFDRSNNDKYLVYVYNHYASKENKEVYECRIAKSMPCWNEKNMAENVKRELKKIMNKN